MKEVDAGAQSIISHFIFDKSYEGKKAGKHYWKCVCECGNEVTVCQSNLKNGHTISCGCMNTPYAARTLVDGTCIESLRGAIEKKDSIKEQQLRNQGCL